MALYDPPKPEIVLPLFERAADEMERRGWCAGELMTITGRVCLIGAIALATGASREDVMNDICISTDPRIANAARSIGFKTIKKAAEWNDKQKSPAAVLDRIRRAARGEFL